MEEQSISRHAAEVASGERFRFGDNWSRFLKVVDDDRIAEAMASLRKMLELEDLKGKTFLDAGSGSGLFSLAARSLGASVHSIDYDPQSVACTRELRRRYFQSDPLWRVDQGSVLDKDFIRELGRFDIVYSWGVLHHTGAMWQALDNVAQNVAPGGRLFVSLYNDQGTRSVLWRQVKKAYCSGTFGKVSVLALFVPYFAFGGLIVDLARGNNPVFRYSRYKQSRGMSRVHDWVDWLGGYPFEVAKPEAVMDFCQARGFHIQRLTTRGGGHGCNEFVFASPSAEGKRH